MVSSPTRTASRPSAPATIRPRRVLRNDAGASVSSLRRKWGKLARSMSRVVISAVTTSRRLERQGAPVVARRVASPPGVPAPSRSRRHDLALGGLPVHAHVPRRSPRPARTARWPPRRRPRPGRCRGTGPTRTGPGASRRARPAVDAAMATDPSKRATVCRNASSSGSPSARRRDTMVGMTLASVVISGGSDQAFGQAQVGVVVDVAVEGGDHVGAGRAARPPRS